MSRNRTTRRFAVPVAIAAGVVTIAAGAGIVSASSGSELPPRSAAELLADVQNSDIKGLSGTVMQTADLGLPDLGSGAAGLSALASGSNQIRLWYAAPDKLRTAVMDDLGETDVIRNGADVWTWASQSNEANHYTLPDPAADASMWPPSSLDGASPEEMARKALAAIEPSTEVSAEGTVEVADRDAYQLVLRPKDDSSLVSEVNLAIDAETGVPLRTEVYAVGNPEPVFDVAFSRVEFTVPDAENFSFTPPADVTVTEGTDDVGGWWQHSQDGKAGPEPEVVGDGWTQVLVTEFDLDKLIAETGDAADSAEQEFGGDVDLNAMLEALPEISGDWGSGRLFSSSLVNALITDDGRLIMGTVTAERLSEVAATE